MSHAEGSGMAGKDPYKESPKHKRTKGYVGRHRKDDSKSQRIGKGPKDDGKK